MGKRSKGGMREFLVEKRKQRQQRQKERLESRTANQVGEVVTDEVQPEVQDDVEVAETQEVADSDSENESVSQDHTAEGDTVSHEGGVVEEYAQATLDLQNTLKQQWKNFDEVRGEIDKRLYARLQENSDVDLEDFIEIRQMLDGISLVSEKSGADMTGHMFTNEELVAVSDYLQVKHTFDTAIHEKLEGRRGELREGNSEDAVEAVLEVLLAYENSLLDEEIRLRQNVGGEVFERVKAGWRWLGDQNLATSLSDGSREQMQKTFWGRMKHRAMQAVSMRTILMGSLVPVAGIGFGVAGASAAIGVKRAIGALAGGSAGRAFVKTWFDKNLKKRVDALSDLQTFKKKDYEMAISLKKEYDAFILQYHSDTADEVREGDAYKKVEKVYCEAIMSFCKDAESVEKLRAKQNEGEVKARNILKKHKWKLFAATIGGGAISAFVAPKVIDAVAGVAGDLLPGDADVPGGVAAEDTPNTNQQSPEATQPSNTPTNKVEQVSEPADNEDAEGTNTFNDSDDGQEIPLSPSAGDFATVEDGADSLSLEDKDAPASTPPPEIDGGAREVEQDGADTANGEFLVGEGGKYVVQDGNWLSTIWLHKNGGDEQQMMAVMQALEDLQDTDGGVEKLKELFGISSGDIEKIYPGDEIDTDAIQEWFEAREVEAPTATTDTAPNAEGASKTTDAESVVVADSQSDEKNILTKDTLKHDLNVQSGDSENVPLEDLKGLKETFHTVTDEGTVADVLQSFGFDAVDIPQNILDEPLSAGQEVQILTTQKGDFAGITIDGEPLSLSESLTDTSSGEDIERMPEMRDGEKLPFTDTLADLVETAESLNAGMEDVRNHITIARADGTPILPASELQQLRPDLFESEQGIASTIVKRDDAVLLQLDHPPQKRFLIETNQKGALHHDHIQKEFEAIEKTVKKPAAIHSAKQEVIKKSLISLTVEKPPANPEMFNTLIDRVSATIEHDADLTERMFSEKGWGDKRVRIAYSEDQKYLEVQEYLNENRGKRYNRPKWKWKSVLVEKIATKK